MDNPPLNLETPLVKDMYSDRFQRSKSRLWLTVLCASLSIGSEIASTANIPAFSQPTSRPNEANQAPAPVVIQSIRQVVKKQFGVAKIVVVSVTEQNWPDGCLGLPKAEEVCTMAIVPGWRIEVSDKLQTWFYRTDRTGKTLRLENPQRSILPQAVASKLIQQVARETNTQPGKLRITEVLTQDGKITRYQSSPTAKFAPVVIKTLSLDRLNAFKKTLGNRQFPNFNGLTYLTSAALADYPTTTYQSQSAATQFIDLEKQSLPGSLQQLIQSWESLIAPNK
jgi:hypothetical protein